MSLPLCAAPERSFGVSARIQVVTVSLNPAVDQTLIVPGFAVGAVNRVERVHWHAGGKGVNVASFLADAGFKVAATGFLGGENDQLFTQLFRAKAIDDAFVRLPGPTRVNVKILDPAAGDATDVNLPGFSVAEDHLTLLLRRLDALVYRADWFVLSGSLPSGVSVGVYADLVRRLKAQGKGVVLDASGPAFSEAVDAGPDIIKPNLQELRELMGEPLESPQAILAAARSLIGRGIGLVAISLGAEGALLVESDVAVRVSPPETNVETTVGAGDAMVAGLLVATLRGWDLEAKARLATAFAVGSMSAIGPHLPPLSRIEGLVAHVEVRSLTAGG